MSTINHNGTSKKINKQPREPRREFRGTFAVAELHNLVETGTISATAAWLAMTIDAYSSKKRWCFASNAYLANKINRGLRQTQNLLRELEDAKILKTCWRGDQRYLKMTFDKPAKSTRAENYRAERRHAKNCTSDMQNIAHRKIDTNVSKKKDSRRSADDGVKSLFIGERSEGFLSVEKDTSRQADEKRATRLRKAMKEIFYDSTDLTHRCNFIPHANDYKHIEKIRHDPQYADIDIDALIDDYIEIMGQPFVPETHTVKSFREKLPRIIIEINKRKKGGGVVTGNGRTYTGI